METKILIVDDDDAFRKLMMDHLSSRGFCVEGAQDGYEAIQMLRSDNTYAVLVTDMMMPGVGGLELLRIARKMNEDMEVIVITASGSIEAAVSALREDGAFDFLTKPLGMMAELSIAVDRALRYRELRTERKKLRGQQAADADRVQTVVSHVSDDVIAVDPAGRLEMINASAHRYLSHFEKGASVHELLPESLNSVVSSWKAMVKCVPACASVHLKKFGLKEIHLSRVCANHDWDDGWVMVIRDRMSWPGSEKYTEYLLTDLEEVGMCHGRLVRTFSGLAGIPGLSSGPARQLIGGGALLLKKMEKYLHRIRSAVEFSSHPDAGVSGRILAAGPVVEVSSLADGVSQDHGQRVDWNIPDGLSPVRGDVTLIREALEVYRELSDPSMPAVSVSARENSGWVWLELEPVSGKHVSEPQKGCSPVGEQKMVQLVVQRMGGQLWKYSIGGTAYTAVVLQAAGSKSR